MRKKDRVLYILALSIMVGSVLFFIALGIVASLKITGIKVNPRETFLIVYIGTIAFLSGLLAKKIWPGKINNYFITACTLSIVTLIIGFIMFTNIYKSETDFFLYPRISNLHDYNIVTQNGTINLFNPLNCNSGKGRAYFSNYDYINCELKYKSNNLSSYNLSYLEGYKFTTNNTFDESTKSLSCQGNESCEINLYTMTNSRAFSVNPVFILSNNSIYEWRPVNYYFETPELLSISDVGRKEQDRTLFLIAIIAAALIVVWTGVSQAKDIIEHKKR